jgi:hypothetical protein
LFVCLPFSTPLKEKYIYGFTIETKTNYLYFFRFYCPYGKEDHRFDPKHKKSKNKGCLTRFAVRQLQLYPHIDEVIYYHSEHTRENGEVAHGVMNPDSIARRSEVAPRISEELKT